MDLRSYDLSQLDLSHSLNDLLFADFDTQTRWPPAAKMPAKFDWQQMMELGKNPGLGIRSLHAQGITGRGVGLAIVDQPLVIDHQEYADRLRLYEEINIDPSTESQMHGPAVASIAVGKTVGVAPEADLYYIGAWTGDWGTGGPDDFTWNFHYYAQATKRLLEINRQLPEDHKIRVIAMQIGWQPEDKGYDEIMAAIEEAKSAGVLVISSSLSETYGLHFQGLGRSPLADPEAFESYEPGLFWAKRFYDGQPLVDRLLVPMDSRTTAGFNGTQEYAFYRSGGWSWVTPYIAGVYALAIQVKPSITPDEFWALALKTGRTIQVKQAGRTLPMGPILDPVALIGALQTSGSGPSTSTPITTPNWSELTPYRAAMRPEFAADVDQFAQATQYKIDLTIASDLASYTAVQQVHFVNQQTTPLDKIYFRLFPNAPTYGGELTITALQVNGTQVKPTMEVGNTALRIDMQPPLKPQAAVDFILSYTAQVPTTLNDSGYNLFGVYSHTLSLANFYPLIPAYDDKGWHIEPAPKYGDAGYSETALYQVNIEAPADQVVATSGMCQTTGDGATKTWHCVSGPMRDFMIAMSADYQLESSTINGVKVNSYFWKNDKVGGQLIWISGITALKSFEKRIGAYPFNEMDLLETPTTAGACEFPGLMVFAADAYSDESLFASHEVAHQWWYSLVGDDQVNEPWLDEALTTFTTYLWMQDEYGPGTFQQVIDSSWMRYSQVKGKADDRRVDLPADSYTSGTQYSMNVYRKGSLFFNALYETMGDEKFNKFLQAYFKANRYGIAHKADLLKALATQIDQQTLAALLKQWVTTPE